jgi:hypothetical protein
MHPFIKALSVFVVTGSLISACSTTTPTSEWKKPGYQGGYFDSFAIVGVSANTSAKRHYEDLFAETLRGKGVTAFTSYSLLSDSIEPSAESLEGPLKERNVDAVVTAHMVGTDVKTVSHPPRWEAVPSYYGSYGRYYGYYRQVYRPGYTSQHQYSTLETNLYNAKTGELLWTMRTESVDPSSTKSLIQELVNLSVDKLKANGFLK